MTFEEWMEHNKGNPFYSNPAYLIPFKDVWEASRKATLLEVIMGIPLYITWAIDPPHINIDYVIRYIKETIRVVKGKANED